jgi:predicted ester cyclase
VPTLTRVVTHGAQFEGEPRIIHRTTHVVADGDMAAVWATYSGTQTGALGAFPASGKRAEFDVAGVVTQRLPATI